MVAPNDAVSLTVDKPAVGGRMIARLDGQIVFVAGAIPGERVSARVERSAKGIVYADTVSVEEASADRRPAAADPSCGGCVYSHIAYPRQLAIKRELLADAFGRIGHLELPSQVGVSASPEHGYRMRARLHVRGRRVGFFREGTHEVCDARQTAQLLPETCDTIDRLTAALNSLELDLREIELSENLDATERVVHLEAEGDGGQWNNPRRGGRPASAELLAVEGLTPGPFVRDALTLGGQRLTLRRHVRGFFQGNRYLLRDLAAHVTGQVPAGSTALDLYAGAGLFSIAAAVHRGATVTAVEGDRFAAADLRANAAASGGRLTTVRAAVEEFLATLPSGGGRGRSTPAIETIIVDPPRAGMSRAALEGVLRVGAVRLIYVSCDVATLARDARRIVDAGYAIDRVDLFDLFPNTPHVETVVVFQDLA